jgi:hypothetical protein
MSDTEVTKNEIIAQIRKLAKEANGTPPGQRKFASETGIKEHVWRGKIWVKWTDALAEAGHDALEWQTGYEDNYLLSKIAGLAAKIGRFPSQTEIQFESAQNADFPGHKSFTRRWSMSQLAEALAKHAVETGNSVVAGWAETYLTKKPVTAQSDITVEKGVAKGHVYMQQVDKKFRIGKTNSLVGRYRQVQLETPHQVEYVHTILTDDPEGVEKYWHKRFKPLKLQIGGDWYALKASDIAAFKRWKKIW